MQTEFVNVTITFVSGEKLDLVANLDPTQQLVGGSKASEMMNSTMLAFEIDGVLHLFPTVSIRSITIDPAPGVATSHTFGSFRLRTR
jgi:hypothetical protein